MRELTERQTAVLEYVRASIREHGTSPSCAQIAAAVGLRSKSAAHYQVHRLEARGLVRLLDGRAGAALTSAGRGPG